MSVMSIKGGVKPDVTFDKLMRSNFAIENWEGKFSKLAIADAHKMLDEINKKSDTGDMTAKMKGDNMAITINNVSPQMSQMTQTDDNFKMGNISGSGLVLDQNDIFSLYHMHKEIDAIDTGRYNKIIPNISKMWETISAGSVAAPIAQTPEDDEETIELDFSDTTFTEDSLDLMMKFVLDEHTIDDVNTIDMLKQFVL